MARRANKSNTVEIFQIGGLGVVLLFPLILCGGGDLLTAIIGAFAWLAAIIALAYIVSTRSYRSIHHNLGNQLFKRRAFGAKNPLIKSNQGVAADTELIERFQNPS